MAFLLPGTPWMRLLIGGGASLLLCIAVMSLEAPLFSRRGWRWVAGLGTASMAIYVAHTIFSAAVRIVLLKAGVTDIWVHLAVGTLVGLAGPLMLYLLAWRGGVAGWLGL